MSVFFCSQNRDVNSAQSAHFSTGRWRNNHTRKVEDEPNKRPKNGGDKSAVAILEDVTTVGLCIAGRRAAGICSDFTEGHKSFGTTSTSTIHKSCATSSKHPDKTKVHRWRKNTSQTSSSAQSLRREIWGPISGWDWKTSAMRPRRRVETSPRNIFQRKDTEKTTFYSPSDEWFFAGRIQNKTGGKRVCGGLPEQGCIWSAGKTWTMPNWKP